MKVTNRVENAVTGVTINLSIAEQMVLASLQNTLQEVTRPSNKRVLIQSDTINNVIAFLSKLTDNTYDLKSVEEELFAPKVDDNNRPGKTPLTYKARD